jgi:hypothetical protein
MKSDSYNNYFEILKNDKRLINKKFRPLTIYISNNYDNIDCEKIKDYLYFFKAFPIPEVVDNNTFICYSNLLEMHKSSKTPNNVFWVSTIDIFKILPNNFIESLKTITDKIFEKGFWLRHFFVLRGGNTLTIFRYFEKHEHNVHIFYRFLFSHFKF